MAERCFVDSLAQVSCQKPLSDEWFDTPCFYTDRYVRSVEPDVKGFIAASEARRMSRILKRAVCTSVSALRASSVDMPDAVITGTGSGCMENSEKFLIDLGRFGEQCLKPTLFMQSTHNTISSMIAIMMRCHGYNNTYSHKGISFDSALFDAWLQIRSGMIGNALVGSHDEVTPFMELVMRRTQPDCCFVTEASVSAVLTRSRGENTVCEVDDVKLLHKPDMSALADMFEEDRDRVLMLGLNGSESNDAPYMSLLDGLRYRPLTLRYRNLFGDCFSASALGFYAACRVLERGSVPAFMYLPGAEQASAGPEAVTIVNHSDATDWSVVRLKRVVSCGG